MTYLSGSDAGLTPLQPHRVGRDSRTRSGYGPPLQVKLPKLPPFGTPGPAVSAAEAKFGEDSQPVGSSVILLKKKIWAENWKGMHQFWEI